VGSLADMEEEGQRWAGGSEPRVPEVELQHPCPKSATSVTCDVVGIPCCQRFTIADADPESRSRLEGERCSECLYFVQRSYAFGVSPE